MHAYPTSFHELAATAVVNFFSGRDDIGAVLLVNSCARGRATPTSDLDMVVLVPDGGDQTRLLAEWEHFRANDPGLLAFSASGPFATLHLDIEEAHIQLPDHPADEYPDGFELVIGNWLVWSRVLWEREGFHERLRGDWLPYYDDELRQKRLKEIRLQCVNNLRLIPAYIDRELYFQAFSRLWESFRLFLQALFIQRRTYPISYDKWIREQVVDMLGLPGLYQQLPPLFEIDHFESDALVAKGSNLLQLLTFYIPDGDDT
jgi:predicted nucleotidyltransferase